MRRMCPPSEANASYADECDDFMPDNVYYEGYDKRLFVCKGGREFATFADNNKFRIE